MLYVYKAVHGMASGYIMELHYGSRLWNALHLTLDLYLPLISIENICFLWLLIVDIWKLYFILSYCYVSYFSLMFYVVFISCIFWLDSPLVYWVVVKGSINKLDLRLDYWKWFMTSQFCGYKKIAWNIVWTLYDRTDISPFSRLYIFYLISY